MREVNQTVELVGSGLARRKSTVAAQTSGAVKKMVVEEGDVVKEKDILVILDTRDQVLEIEAAVAAKTEAQSRHKQAQERLKRSEALFKKGRISEEEYKDDLHSEAALKARTTQQDAALRRLNIRLEKASVKAPFNGVVTAKHTEIGEWVNKGGPVADVIDLSSIHILLDLPERYLPRLQRKEPVTVRARSLPGKTLSGSIYTVVPEADEEARTVPIKVEVNNEDGALHAGMYFRVKLTLDEKRKAMLIPKDAVVSQGPVNFVYAVLKGAAIKITVQRLDAYGASVEVRGELKPGMQVITRGNERIMFSGQPVKILPTKGR